MLLQSLGASQTGELGRLGAHDFVSITRFPDATRSSEVLVLRPEEPLLFANVDPVLALARARVLHASSVKLVVLSLEESPDLDASSLESLSRVQHLGGQPAYRAAAGQTEGWCPGCIVAGGFCAPAPPRRLIIPVSMMRSAASRRVTGSPD